MVPSKNVNEILCPGVVRLVVVACIKLQKVVVVSRGRRAGCGSVHGSRSLSIVPTAQGSCSSSRQHTLRQER